MIIRIRYRRPFCRAGSGTWASEAVFYSTILRRFASRHRRVNVVTVSSSVLRHFPRLSAMILTEADAVCVRSHNGCSAVDAFAFGFQVVTRSLQLIYELLDVGDGGRTASRTSSITSAAASRGFSAYGSG